MEPSNNLLNSTIEALEHPFYLIDVNNYQVLKANTASGIKKDEQTTCYSLTHNRSKPCSGEEHPCPMEIIKRTKQSTKVEHLHYDEEGNTIDVEVHAHPVFNEKGELIQIIEYCLDITERKQEEMLIQSRLNIMELSYTNTLETVLQKIVDKVCKITGSKIGFCHFVSKDEKTLTLKAWSTDTIEKYCPLGDQSGMNYKVDEVGVWADCVRERRPVIHNDYPSLTQRQGLPEKHAQITRELVVPIMRQGKIVAILGVGNKPHNYTDKDIEIATYFTDIAWEVAERKSLEEQFDLQVQMMLDIAPGFIIVHDFDGNLYYSNQHAADLYGFTKEEFMNKNLHEFHTPENLELIPSRMEEINKKGEGHFEAETCRKDGLILTLKVYAKKIEWYGKPAILSIGADITDRKQSEEELKFKSVILNTQQEVSLDGILVLDAYFNIISYNQRFANIWGIPDDLMASQSGSKALEYVLPKLVDPEEFVNRIHYLHENTQEQSHEEVELTDGITLERYSAPMVSHDGHYYGRVWYYRDITERKQAEKELKEISAEYQTVFQSSQDAMFLIKVVDDETFQFIRNNQSHVQSTGLKTKDLRGKTPQDILGEEGGAPVVENYSRCVQEKKPIKYEETLDFPKGKKTWSTVLTPVIKNEDVCYIVGSARDITERKREEQKVHDYAMDLELKGLELEHKNLEINNLYERLSEEISKAEKVHKRLLPSNIESIQDISITSYFQPAENIGGDFYNVIRKKDKLVFYISDVTGHGLEGAIVSAFIKESIDSYLDLKPDEIKTDKILKHLYNQYKSEDYPEDYFICIFLGVLDLQTYDLEYIGMGFQESFLVSLENGDKLKLNVEGLPITKAIPEDIITFNVKNIKLEPKTTLMINSDGLTEQVNKENEMFKERLHETFFANSHLPVEVLKSVINEEFRSFNNGILQGFDDITYLLIKLDEDDMDLCETFDSKFEELSTLDTRIYNCFVKYSVDKVYFQGLKELVINAIEHGNNFDENKKVYVTFKNLKDKLIITVEDEGDGFDWIDFLDNKCLDLEGEEERGRGIVMTKIMCGNIFYNEKGNKAFLILEKAE